MTEEAKKNVSEIFPPSTLMGKQEKNIPKKAAQTNNCLVCCSNPEFAMAFFRFAHMWKHQTATQLAN